MSTPAGSETGYSFAILRVVPHPHLGAFANVGVVLHARTADYLGIRLLEDRARLAERAGDVDLDLLVRYLASCRAICEGDGSAGPVALSPPSERFHWITSPRSDVLQCSPIHEGVTADLDGELVRLFEDFVQVGR